MIFAPARLLICSAMLSVQAYAAASQEGDDHLRPVQYEYLAEFYFGRLYLSPNNANALTLESEELIALKSATRQVINIGELAGISVDEKIAQMAIDNVITEPKILIQNDGARFNQIKLVEESLQQWKSEGITIAASSPGANAGIVLAQLEEDTVAGMSLARMKEIARQTAEQLFSEAASSACASNIRPREISPSLSVSFNFFAGAEFAIEATFDVKDLCEQLER